MYSSSNGYGQVATAEKDRRVEEKTRYEAPYNGNYWEPTPGTIVSKIGRTAPTIDHDPPVSNHWNKEGGGHDTDQRTRRDFFIFKGRLSDIKVVQAWENTSMGSKGEPDYTHILGKNFKEPGEE
jgi:hypothetical protein